MSTELFSRTGTTVVPLPGAFLAPPLPEDAILLIRFDVSDNIAADQLASPLTRCVALAQEWRFRGGAAIVAANELTDETRSTLTDNGIEWIDVGPTGDDFRQLADMIQPIWVVLDVGSAVHQHLAAIDDEFDVLVVDDRGGHFETSPTLILNQNAHGPSTPYAGIPTSSLLRGLDYVLLRNEFLSEEPLAVASQQSTVLIALDGTEPTHLLPDVVDSLACNSELRILVVASSRHPELDRLEELRLSRNWVELQLDPPDTSHLMNQADLALTSGGTTVWELAYLGIPTIVGASTEIEGRLLSGLNQIDLFETIGSFEDTTVEGIAEVVAQIEQDQAWRKATQVRAQELVDGNGRLRVLDRMASASRLTELHTSAAS